MNTSKLLIVLLTALALGACASVDGNKVGQAASTPLNDLNLVNAPIPELLQAAQRQPYVLPAGHPDCAALNRDIAALDEVLGPDIDAPASGDDKGLVERGGEAVGHSAVGALQRTAEGIVPFRGWVRKLSGAERYSRRVAAAIAAGSARRAFLKGLRAAQACSA